MRSAMVKALPCAVFAVSACRDGTQNRAAETGAAAEGGTEGAASAIPAEGGSEGASAEISVTNAVDAAEAVPSEGGEGH